MILITGCAGFIGYHLSSFYLKKGFKVIGVDNLNDYYNINFKIKRLSNLKKFKNFIFFKTDLRNKNSLAKLKKNKKKISYVIHLAGQAGVRYSFINPVSYVENNITAYINLLEFFKNEKSLVSILYASSSSIYGENLKKRNTPISIYAVSKKTLEEISEVYSEVYKMKFAGMRFFTVYGPNGRPDMSVYKFFDKINSDKKIYVYNYGNHYRSFTYISDIIYNIDKLLKFTKKNVNARDAQVFNIGNPKSIYLKQLIKLIEKIVNKKIKVTYLGKQKGDVYKTKAKNINKSRLIGFKYKVDLENGLNKFYEWFKNEK